jgi:hypothetical protein
MVLAGMLEKATTLATSARRACAAASTVTVVALQITAPLQRAVRHPLVAAQVRFVSPSHLAFRDPGCLKGKFHPDIPLI